ncbi:MAG: hypothetical protein HC857_12180 [Synechococcales cyanobacterium RU_4_20]|nr:hypothetical protein [Synechococcales cyanobacterium RU_4_20]NJR67507.1 hypothetical protein [Synechococcales cyanobacterium CRU_2_2]
MVNTGMVNTGMVNTGMVNTGMVNTRRTNIGTVNCGLRSSLKPWARERSPMSTAGKTAPTSKPVSVAGVLPLRRGSPLEGCSKNFR